MCLQLDMRVVYVPPNDDPDEEEEGENALQTVTRSPGIPLPILHDNKQP